MQHEYRRNIILLGWFRRGAAWLCCVWRLHARYADASDKNTAKPKKNWLDVFWHVFWHAQRLVGDTSTSLAANRINHSCCIRRHSLERIPPPRQQSPNICLNAWTNHNPEWMKLMIFCSLYALLVARFPPSLHFCNIGPIDFLLVLSATVPNAVRRMIN